MVGILPPSLGFTFHLTCVDRSTRMARSHSTYQRHCGVGSQSILLGSIARYGVPSCIVTDRRRQLESKWWKNLLKLLWSRKARTKVYHPLSNDMVERFHRQLKAALKAQPQPSAWIGELSSAYIVLIKNTLQQQPQRWFTVQPFAYLENSSTPPNPFLFQILWYAYMHAQITSVAAQPTLASLKA